MRLFAAAMLLAIAASAQTAPDLLRARCAMCHDTNGRSLNSPSAVNQMIARVTSDDAKSMMPPMGARLTPAEVALLRTWIDSRPAAKSTHWSFQAITHPAPPVVVKKDWTRNSIDNFVLARLEHEKITPSAEASRATLLRRVTLDLTGLPPTPAEVAAFLTDTRADAYERAVDRLLASPHYGEKWARAWLDLAHYSDSDGYEKDKVRPYAWRYRNWVIDALNSGMPFDQFATQQLAGDLLPAADTNTRVATGFLRQTLTNREGGTSQEEIRFEQLVDRTSTVSTTFIGLTLGCAQCHNHKFDPILQKDFYQFMTFFHQAAEQDIDAPLGGEMGPYMRARPEYDVKRAQLWKENGIDEMEKAWAREIRQEILEPGKRLDWDFEVTAIRAIVDHTDRVMVKDPSQWTPREKDAIDRYFLSNAGPVLNKDKAAKDALKATRDKLALLDAAVPFLTQAMIMEEDPQADANHVRLRGDFKRNGDVALAETPSFLPAMEKGLPRNRLGLAAWIVAPENPLTARVAVNRMWQEFFGIGLVRTSEDFGKQGEAPSHPELLDWLATEFRTGGWNVKAMHRLIVTSATYRQASETRRDIQVRDPENRLLARQSRMRLPAEEIRDAALEASGLLNNAVGGPSVRPPQPAGVSELTYANSGRWVESKGEDRYRRGLYIHFQRTTPYPQLLNFDAPDSMTACSRRRVSDTPLQALNLLNDAVFFEGAQAMAARVLQEAPPTFPARLQYAYTLALGRAPNAQEQARLTKYFEQERALVGASPEKVFALHLAGIDPVDAAAWTGLSRVLLNLDEFVTRE